MSGIPFWARKGAWVVCLDDKFVMQPTAGLVEGHLYQVERAYIRNWNTVEGSRYRGDSRMVKLIGVNCPLTIDGGFALARFRPLVTDSDDNEIETVLYRSRKDKLHQRVSTKSRERA